MLERTFVVLHNRPFNPHQLAVVRQMELTGGQLLDFARTNARGLNRRAVSNHPEFGVFKLWRIGSQRSKAGRLNLRSGRNQLRSVAMNQQPQIALLDVNILSRPLKRHGSADADSVGGHRLLQTAAVHSVLSKEL